VKVGEVRIETGEEFQCFDAQTRRLFVNFYKICVKQRLAVDQRNEFSTHCS